MKVYDCKQNSDEWHRLRMGIPTTSAFDSIMQPKLGRAWLCKACGTEFSRVRKKCDCGSPVEQMATAKKSAQADRYMNWLLAEWVLGVPLENPETQWMQRGHEMEPHAVQSYEFETGREVSTVGFITTDDGMVGSSPDRLVGADGILEIKSPSPQVHVGYMLQQAVDDDYFIQLQGQLYVAERQWADIQSYCPGFPSVIVRVERNEEYIGHLADAVSEFVDLMLKRRQELKERFGDLRPKQRPVEDGMGITDEDVDFLVSQKFPKG